MNQFELAADVLSRNQEMIRMTLADFSDADMLVRPCPGANHTAWQLGHLAAAEARLSSVIFGAGAVELPSGFADKFTKETASNDTPAFFPNKAALWDEFVKVRTAAIAGVRKLTQADLDKPTSGPMSSRIPTHGHIVAMLPVHAAMHVGQFQVIRRKLGKPILF